MLLLTLYSQHHSFPLPHELFPEIYLDYVREINLSLTSVWKFVRASIFSISKIISLPAIQQEAEG